MTTFEEVETLAMTYIKNDESLEYDMMYRLPVFYNRMRSYLKAAIPKFNRPPEMSIKLSHRVEAQYNNVMYTPDETIEKGTVIDTEISGFDIVSCGIVSIDKFGAPSYTMVKVDSYDPETGDLTLGEDIYGGTDLVFDFYKSGWFEDTLTDTEIGLLAMCIYNAYEHRFDNNVLERLLKIKDASFGTISEAAQTTANTGRLNQVDEELYDALRAFEQGQEYLRKVVRYM